MPGDPWRFFRHDRARSRGDGGFETVGPRPRSSRPARRPLGRCAPPAGRGSRQPRRGVRPGRGHRCWRRRAEGCLAVVGRRRHRLRRRLGGAVDGDDPHALRARRRNDPEERSYSSRSSRRPRPPPRAARSTSATPAGARSASSAPTSGAAGPGSSSTRSGSTAPRSAGWAARSRASSRPPRAGSTRRSSSSPSGRTRWDGRPRSGGVRGRRGRPPRALREDAPVAAVLVTGPPDRGSRSRRVARLLADNEPAVIRALRAAAGATGERVRRPARPDGRRRLHPGLGAPGPRGARPRPPEPGRLREARGRPRRPPPPGVRGRGGARRPRR